MMFILMYHTINFRQLLILMYQFLSQTKFDSSSVAILFPQIAMKRDADFSPVRLVQFFERFNRIGCLNVLLSYSNPLIRTR